MPAHTAVRPETPDLALAESIIELAGRCLTFEQLRRRPSMPPAEPFALYDEFERLPRTALLVYGVVRKAVAAGGAGARLSYPQLAELVGSCRRACVDAVARLVELELLRVIHTRRPDSRRALRGKNIYLLGGAAQPVRRRKHGAKPSAENARERPERSVSLRGKTDPASQNRAVGASKVSTASAVDQKILPEAIRGDELAAWRAELEGQLDQEPAKAPESTVAPVSRRRRLGKWADDPERLAAFYAIRERCRLADARVTVVDGVGQPASGGGEDSFNPEPPPCPGSTSGVRQ